MEVARKAGVSEATVSRVLNGKAGVPDATRTAALTALDVLGDERPTKLRGDRARLAWLVLPELQNPIFPAFAAVATGALGRRVPEDLSVVGYDDSAIMTCTDPPSGTCTCSPPSSPTSTTARPRAGRPPRPPRSSVDPGSVPEDG